MARKSKYSSLLELLQGEDDQDVLRAMVRVMMQEVMQEEAGRHVGADPHERTETRRGHRNGYKPRTVNTRVGRLELEIPQVRGMEPYQPSVLQRYQRSERALLVACAEM